MTPRTELIARLRHYQKEFDYDPFYKETADMLEADEKELQLACTIVNAMGFATGDAGNVAELMQEVEWQIRELREKRDKLQAAARLALDALNESINVPCYGGHPKQEAAAAALKEVLK